MNSPSPFHDDILSRPLNPDFLDPEEAVPPQHFFTSQFKDFAVCPPENQIDDENFEDSTFRKYSSASCLKAKENVDIFNFVPRKRRQRLKKLYKIRQRRTPVALRFSSHDLDPLPLLYRPKKTKKMRRTGTRRKIQWPSPQPVLSVTPPPKKITLEKMAQTPSSFIAGDPLVLTDLRSSRETAVSATSPHKGSTARGRAEAGGKRHDKLQSKIAKLKAFWRKETKILPQTFHLFVYDFETRKLCFEYVDHSRKGILVEREGEPAEGWSGEEGAAEGDTRSVGLARTISGMGLEFCEGFSPRD